jgi:diguanylate cyclase (GGDEF)-like protein/PAS domain S-box-containing protein
MTSLSDSGEHDDHGKRWTLRLWLPLVGIGLCLLLGMTHLQSSLEQQRWLELIERIDRYSQASVASSLTASAFSLTAPASSRSLAANARQVLVGMRLLLPELERLDAEPVHALRGRVDAVEGWLRSGPGPRVLSSELATIRGAMLAMVLNQVASNAQREMWLALLLSLLGIVALCERIFGSSGDLTRGKVSAKVRDEDFLGGAAQALFQGMPAAAVFTDPNDHIVAVNRAYERVTGYAQAEVVGQDVAFNHAGQQEAGFYVAMRERLRNLGDWSGEFWLRNKAGEAFADKVSRTKLVGVEGDSGYLTISQDVVSSDDAKRLMLWQAHHDTLTKLPNRNLFQERMTRVLLRDGGQRGALISIDLDRFKILNDSEGPAKGDQILMEAGVRIAMCARESDTVARLGADHFVVLLQQVEDYGEVERIARSVVDAMARPFRSENRDIYMTASVGVAMIPDDGAETGELLQKADAARIQVKEQGGNNVAFFEPAMNARAERRLLIETELRKAIADGDLELHYQPIIDVKRGMVGAAEALLRWPHAELGMISPGEFIPVAEDSGLIIEVGEWVLGESKRQLAIWREQGLSDLRLALNVSAVQIRNEVDAKRLVDGLRDSDNDGIVLELTESALIENSDGVQKFLRDVRELGCQVALDDFGTGFSSLAYLRKFEFDTLKIDKTFIDELSNPRDYGLVASIVSMGRILGMRVVAEGVETAEQAQQLRQIGCDFIQGFLYSKPLPAAQFFEFVTDTELRQVG